MKFKIYKTPLKSIQLFLAAFLFTAIGIAQSYQEEVELFQSIYGKDKKEIVSLFVELDDSQKTNFWNLYDEYEMKRKELSKDKIAVIMNYVNDYGDVKAMDAEMFMSKVLPLRKKSDKLVDSYYGKIKKKTN